MDATVENLAELIKKYLQPQNIDIELLAAAWLNGYRGIIPTHKYGVYNKLLLPNRPHNSKSPVRYFLREYCSLKLCYSCNSILPLEDFRANSSSTDGLQSHCTVCQSYVTAKTQAGRQAAYRARKLNATPAWADQAKIKALYDSCPKGYHVDHIIPLQGETVCGLHVEYNLQILTAEDNCSKSNKF